MSPRHLVAIVMVGLLLAAGCAGQERSAVRPTQDTQWQVYRRGVEPTLRRVLGPTEGLVESCRRLSEQAPPPRFGIDVAPTLRACAANDLSQARQLAHGQIDLLGANESSTHR